MHVFRAGEAERTEPPGHFGHLELADIVTEANDARFRAQLSYCPPGAGGELHDHAEHDQLFIVIDGELTFDTGTERFTLHEQDAVLFHAGDPHHTLNESDKPSVSVVVTVGA